MPSIGLVAAGDVAYNGVHQYILEGGGGGLVGLKDRAEALGGRLSLHSTPEAGTNLQAELPLTAAVGVTSR